MQMSPSDAMIRGRLGSVVGGGSAQVELSHNNASARGGHLEPQLSQMHRDVVHGGLRGVNSTGLSFLQETYGCACTFSGACDCASTMQFMACIKDECTTGGCRCQAADFLKACDAVAATCPTSKITCAAGAPAVPGGNPSHYRAQCVTTAGPTANPTTSHFQGSWSTSPVPEDEPCEEDKKRGRHRRRRRSPQVVKDGGRDDGKTGLDLPTILPDDAPTIVPDEVEDIASDGAQAFSVEWPMPWYGAPDGPWADGKQGKQAGRL
jgi:hypothetical protein